MKRLFALMAAMILLMFRFGLAEAPLVESEETMANIPQVNVGGIVYNLKDTKAREQISDLLIDIADFSEMETITKNGITFTVDKNNRTVTVNGTATATVLYYIKEDYAITGSTEILISGGADGGASATYNLAFFKTGGGRLAYLTNSDEEQYVTLEPNSRYSLGIAVFAGQTVNNLVFKPRGYVSGEFLGLKKKTEKIDEGQSRFNYYDGIAFICECGEHIYIDSKGYRVYDKKNKTYTAEKSDTEILNGGSESIRYVCFDGEHFNISATYADTAIAYVAHKTVTPFLDGIIPNYRAIQDGYLRSGSEYTINFARTPINAYAAYSETDVKISKQAYTYTTTGAKRYRVGREPMAFTLNENTVNINNKKILIIGDSFVSRGYIQNWLHELNGTLSFVGTKTTQTYNYKSEGVSGSRLYYFTDPETSPFYFNGQLNFALYLSTNNIAEPDYVVINSAINHGAFNNDEHGSYLQNLKDLVNMIKNYNSGIKIYVTYGANYAIEPGCDYGYSINRYEEVRKCENSVYDVEGITVVPVDYCLVDELDYDYKTYNYYGDEIKILSDCVHPKENSGFKKIAYMIYNYLGL